MRKVVCEQKLRPNIPNRWQSCEVSVSLIQAVYSAVSTQEAEVYHSGRKNSHILSLSHKLIGKNRTICLLLEGPCGICSGQWHVWPLLDLQMKKGACYWHEYLPPARVAQRLSDTVSPSSAPFQTHTGTGCFSSLELSTPLSDEDWVHSSQCFRCMTCIPRFV